MGERKDLRDLLRDTDFTQKRIIDDLANTEVEDNPAGRDIGNEIRRSEGGDFIKNVFLGFLLIAIVIGSFWVSFLIGKKILVPPVKNLPAFEIPVPKAITKSDLDRAEVLKEEPPIIEKEIKPNTPKPVVKKSKPVAVKKTAKKASIKGSVTPAAVAIDPSAPAQPAKFYKVIVGSYKTSAKASKVVSDLKVIGFSAYAKKTSLSFRVQAGAFDTKDKALPLVAKLKAKGYTPSIILE